MATQTAKRHVLWRRNQNEGPCAVENCGGHARARGWCSAHYMRWKRYGDASTPRKTRVRGRCSVSGCDRPHQAHGWCMIHYYHWRTHDDPLYVWPSQRPYGDGNIGSPVALARMLGVSRQRADQLLHADKHRARKAIWNGRRAGRIHKPTACIRCHKKTKELDAHHPDYSRPLVIRWLCVPCHNIVHPHGYKGYKTGAKDA